MDRKVLRLLPREPLSRDDDQALRLRFHSRLRGFFSAGAIVVILVALEAGPLTAKLNAAITDAGLRWLIGLTIVIMLAIAFYRRVWIFHRDRRAGFKHVDHMLVIGKNAPRGNGHFSINLEDLRYQDVPVSPETYERLQPGDRYPVSYAAKSGYPLHPRCQLRPS